MNPQAAQPPPLLAGVTTVTETLTKIADANPSFLATNQKATVLLEIARAEAQLAELKLRVMADAGDVAADTPASPDAHKHPIADPAQPPQTRRPGASVPLGRVESARLSHSQVSSRTSASVKTGRAGAHLR
ncbi:MAG: hypothetical protein ACRDXB_19925, partial [Actinomycetes bacterium]|uniref:hypothetical protein n=1 Tax=Nocardioides sp. TaxID=35761 RepID=UPI003D6A082D